MVRPDGGCEPSWRVNSSRRSAGVPQRSRRCRCNRHQNLRLAVRSTTRALAALARGDDDRDVLRLRRCCRPRPPGHAPLFVTEREAAGKTASGCAQMLLDKWTSGVTRVDRRQLLEASSGEHRQGPGPSLADVTKAFSRFLASADLVADRRRQRDLAGVLARLESGGVLSCRRRQAAEPSWSLGIEPSGHVMAQRTTMR